MAFSRATRRQNLLFKPISAISLIVCLIAHIMLSKKSLNVAGGNDNNAIQYLSNLLINEMGLLRTREAVIVNNPEQFEKPDSVFWELGKVFIDHGQCWLKNGIQDSWNLRG